MGDVKNTVKLDKWDYIIATSSGAVTAGLDVFFVNDISLTEAHTWGRNKVETFVKKVAGKDDLKSAITELEKCKIPADSTTNDFGGGRHHHMRDFSHHPTIVGLMFSLLTQFTETVYGTDKYGNFQQIRLEEKGLKYIGKSTPQKIYNGTIMWFFHMISDMAGSSTSASNNSDGTGLPGPLLSMLKEISALPAIRNLLGSDEAGYSNFSRNCQKLFNGTFFMEKDENGKNIKESIIKFDLRTELGVTDEVWEKKQYFPVLLNDMIVRVLYTIRRFADEIRDKQICSFDDLRSINWRVCLPFRNRPLTHMIAISSATFSAIEISAAGVKAAVRNKGNSKAFALDFVQSINYIGIFRLTASLGGEASLALSSMYEKFAAIAEKQRAEHGELISAVSDAASLGMTVARVTNPVGMVSAAVDVFRKMDEAVKEYNIARDERLLIESECAESIAILLENRAEIESAVNEYMTSNLTLFNEAFAEIETAISENDTDRFIHGNNIIRNQLGRETLFDGQSDFDGLMESDDTFEF